MPFFRKNFFQNFPRKAKIWIIFKKNLKNVFSKMGPKMSMGRSPIAIFFLREFFHRKFVQKIFRDWGSQKSMILGLSSKIDVQNFCQLGKACFSRPRFFRNIEEMGGYFWGCPEIIFIKTYWYRVARV